MFFEQPSHPLGKALRGRKGSTHHPYPTPVGLWQPELAWAQREVSDISRKGESDPRRVGGGRGRRAPLLGLVSFLSLLFHCSSIQQRPHPTPPGEVMLPTPPGAGGGLGQDVSPAGSSRKPPTPLPSYTHQRGQGGAPRELSLDTRGTLSPLGLCPRGSPVPGLESQDALPLATRMET